MWRFNKINIKEKKLIEMVGFDKKWLDKEINDLKKEI